MPSTGGGNSGSGGFSGGSGGTGSSGSGFSTDSGRNFVATSRNIDKIDSYDRSDYSESGTAQGENPTTVNRGLIVVLAAFFLISLVSVTYFILSPVNKKTNYEPTYSFSYNYSVASMTEEAQQLDAAYVTDIGVYLSDDVGLLTQDDKTTIVESLEYFYNTTGVAPYLYITDALKNDDALDNEKADKWLYAKYSKLFKDEGHLLIMYNVYNEDMDYVTWYCVGDNAKEVVTYDYCQHLLDLIDEYHTSSSGYAEMFESAFVETAFYITEPADSYIQIPDMTIYQNGIEYGEVSNDSTYASGAIVIVLPVLLFIVLTFIIILKYIKKNNLLKTKKENKTDNKSEENKTYTEKKEKKTYTDTSVVEDPWDNVNKKNDDPWEIKK